MVRRSFKRILDKLLRPGLSPDQRNRSGGSPRPYNSMLPVSFTSATIIVSVPMFPETRFSNDRYDYRGTNFWRLVGSRRRCSRAATAAARQPRPPARWERPAVAGLSCAATSKDRPAPQLSLGEIDFWPCRGWTSPKSSMFRPSGCSKGSS